MQPNAARIYGYWLGGKDHYASDREAADKIASVAPCVVTAARANRSFVRRAVTAMAREGIDQFLDLGCGMPTDPAVHEVARSVGALAPVTVYVDHDDVVLAHARAAWGGAVGVKVLAGDLLDLDAVLADPELPFYLDLARPVGVLLTGVLHALDDVEVTAVLTRLRDSLAPGSCLALTQVGPDGAQPRPAWRSTAGRLVRGDHRAAATRDAARLYAALVGPCRLRSRDQVAHWLDGWTLLEPGLTDVGSWRRSTGAPRRRLPVMAAVGRLERLGG